MMYKVIKEEKGFLDFGPKNVYGISLVKDNCEISRVSDISTNRTFVETLAKKLNKLDVSTLHFKDVIQDFVALQEK